MLRGAQMVRLIDWRGLQWDSRGGKAVKWETRRVRGGVGLLVECPEWVAAQIDLFFGDECKRAHLKEETAEEYTHGWLFPGGEPADLARLLDLLVRALSIPTPNHVDVAMALDWYYQPGEDGVEKTEKGYWIWTTKHAKEPTWSNSRKSRREMVAATVDFIHQHPLYANATAIIAPPGHKADGMSFGEEFAREIARLVGIPYVESTSTGPREQQKEAPQDLTNAFSVQGRLSGDVIVLDDVYRSGGSASGAAAAARRAGADRVLVLTVARTIRR